MTMGSVLVLILISVTIGFLVGALVYGLRARPEEARQDNGSEAASPPNAVHLWHDPQTQTLSVELEGKIYRKVDDLTPDARGRLARLARDWQLWLGLPSSRLAALAAPSGEASDTPDPWDSQAGAGYRGRTREADTPAAETDKASRHETGSAPQSIAGQIDEILQARLQDTPLAGRGIELIELPDQGLVVRVGSDQYTDLTQVPDEQVRAAIAAAVAEWEQRNAPPAAQAR